MDKNSTKDKNEEGKKVSEETTSNGADTNETKLKIEELENQNKRILADYRNLEKRVDSQRRDWILEANKKLLLNLLPVLDTLMLAEKHSKGDQTLGLSVKQFLDILGQEGVEKIKTKGENFDPNSMECLDTVEGEEGKVIEEVRAGYRLYEKTLRPAQVRVGSAKQNAEQNKGN
jgi:molecular chaperone GrpE